MSHRTPRLFLAAAAVLLISGVCRAGAPANKNPCDLEVRPDTREEILKAFPSPDAAWESALDSKGIHFNKEENSWRVELVNGSNYPAGNRSFSEAFESYCSARAAAAPRKKAGDTDNLPQWARDANAKSRKVWLANYEAQMRAGQGAAARASAMLGGAAPSAAPATPPSAPAGECVQICDQAKQCRENDTYDSNCTYSLNRERGCGCAGR